MKFDNLRELMTSRVVGYRIRFRHANGTPDVSPEPDENIFIRSEEAAHRFARGMSRLTDDNGVDLFNTIMVVRLNVLEDEILCGEVYNVVKPPPTAGQAAEQPLEAVPEPPYRLNFDNIYAEEPAAKDPIPEKEEEPLELNEPVEQQEPSIEHPLIAPAREAPKRRNIFSRKSHD